MAHKATSAIVLPCFRDFSVGNLGGYISIVVMVTSDNVPVDGQRTLVKHPAVCLLYRKRDNLETRSYSHVACIHVSIVISKRD